MGGHGQKGTGTVQKNPVETIGNVLQNISFLHLVSLVDKKDACHAKRESMHQGLFIISLSQGLDRKQIVKDDTGPRQVPLKE